MPHTLVGGIQCSSKMLVKTYKTIQHHKSEDHSWHIHCCKNLIYNLIMTVIWKSAYIKDSSDFYFQFELWTILSSHHTEKVISLNTKVISQHKQKNVLWTCTLTTELQWTDSWQYFYFYFQLVQQFFYKLGF